jgi:hypothetical protein
MYGERFYYSSLERAAYREILAEAGLELLTDEDDQAPTPHVVLIARRPATGGRRRRHTD